jgi:hypothetical protein
MSDRDDQNGEMIAAAAIKRHESWGDGIWSALPRFCRRSGLLGRVLWTLRRAVAASASLRGHVKKAILASSRTFGARFQFAGPVCPSGLPMEFP